MALSRVNSHQPIDSNFRFHTPEEIDAILGKSEAAFSIWKNVSFSERSAKMKIFGNLLLQEKEELARLITAEMGKVIGQSRQEIEKCALTSHYYADSAHSYLSPETIPTGSSKSYISYHPLGPVLAVMPWNFPFWQVIRFAAPALMAGNTGILKHASNVPACASAIERLFLEAGFQEGVFQVVFIEGKKMESVVKDPRIKAVTLTGSETAGAQVARAAGEGLKKTVLELGGSDPFIVLEDADLKFTAEQAVKARMVNTGQSCIAAKRFIVVKSIASQFISLFKQKMASLRQGDPFREDVNYGPLAKEEFASAIHDQVRKSIESGAEVVLGGDWKKEDGAFYPATILVNVKPGMPAYDEEIFGPVAAVIEVENETDAVRVANDTRYGLGASIWTTNIEKGEKLAAQVDSGSVFINKLMASDPKLPFGGIKMSGYGRELSYLGIREFTNIKTVSIG